jgi:hypothetical protein
VEPAGRTKRCSRCRVEKRLDEFRRNRTRSDGRQNRCKPCQIIGNREWAERTGNRRPSGDPEAKRQRNRKRLKRHPEKHRATKAVARALKRGEITRPECCESCGRDPGLNRAGQSLLYAHHEDYSRPLDVEWLCATCHARHHWLSVEDVAA